MKMFLFPCLINKYLLCEMLPHASWCFSALNSNMLKWDVASKSNHEYHASTRKVNNFLFSFSVPVQSVCHPLSFQVVRSFTNVAPCPWSLSLSCSRSAGFLLRRGLATTHSCLSVTECDFHVALEATFPCLLSMSLPGSRTRPSVFLTQTLFFWQHTFKAAECRISVFICSALCGGWL